MTGKFGRTIASATLAASLGSILFGGTAFAAAGHDNDNHNNNHSRVHDEDQGGHGGRGGKNKASCVVPVGASAGTVVGSGGEVDQCNSNGGDGGDGGAGAVDY